MNKNFLQVAIIGAGVIGKKRLDSLLKYKKDKVIGIYDIDFAKAQALARLGNCKAYSNLDELLALPNLDVVIVSTVPKASAQVVMRVLQTKKHVLVEKPLGFDAQQARKAATLAIAVKRHVKVGFNHRYHPAISLAYRLFKQGKIGNVMHIRAIYGHGARPGYDLEWRMKPEFSRGGNLFDQGVHLIDLGLWFLDEFTTAQAVLKNSYWKKSNFEDNAFALLQTSKGQVMQFHTGVTEWKNKFVFEIFGQRGYLHISGLGRSYGQETLVMGIEKHLGKPYTEKRWVFPEQDISWEEEWKDFHKQVLADGISTDVIWHNVAVMNVLDALYSSGQKNKIITIKKK